MADSETLFSLSNFQEQVIKDIVPKNRFEVVFLKAPAIFNDLGFNLSQIPLICDGLDMPGITIQTKESRTYGPQFLTPYQRRFDQIGFSFIITKDYGIKQLFDKWLQAMMGFSNTSYGGNNIAYFSDITAEIQIKNYGFDLQNLYSTTILDAFPIVIRSDYISWENQEIQKLMVEFIYRDIKYDT